jgi:retron-type reverse transcriptase
MLCMLDISKSFDTLDHTPLIEKIADSSLHPNIVRWLSAYISGRKAWCVYGPAKSKSRTLRSGVPQGSVLSPALFNHFVSDCRYPISADGILTSYADDFSLLRSDSDLVALGRKLQANVYAVISWAATKKQTISAAKSQITLLLPD